LQTEPIMLTNVGLFGFLSIHPFGNRIYCMATNVDFHSRNMKSGKSHIIHSSSA
jgi:hypothetical protein